MSRDIIETLNEDMKKEGGGGSWKGERKEGKKEFVNYKLALDSYLCKEYIECYCSY